MEKLNEKNNFLYVTAALVCLLIALPILELTDSSLVEWVIRTLIFTMMVITYISLDFGLWWRRFVGLVLILLVLSTVLRELSILQSTGFAHLLMLLFFFASVAYSAARRVLFSGSIDSNKIIGSIAVYLLLGLIWSMLYLLALDLVPSALAGIEHRRWENNLFETIYFSFITLTSTGYGEITPVHPITRALAFLEALTGTFYMAVVVASLVGAATHHKPPED